MRKIIVFMHVSLDGFTARPNGGMDWIKLDKQIFDSARARTEAADTALYGRKTFEIMDAYWPTAADEPGASQHDIEHGTWYKGVQKVVVSKTLDQKTRPDITIIGADLAAQIAKLKTRTGREIIIFGSPSLVADLTNQRLIDEYWLMVNPILLGTGIPMFKNIPQDVRLKRIENISFPGGVVGMHYAVE